MKKKIIILGAGPAGLTAGYELLKNDSGLDVVIIEQDNAVGGISKTRKFNKALFDLGGHRYFTKNEMIKDWWENFLRIDETDDGLSEDPDIMLKKTRHSSILFNGNYIEYPIKFNKNTIQSLGISNAIKIVASYIITNLSLRRYNSLENFYERNFGKRLYQLFFKDYTEKLWGKKAENISSDWGKQRVQNFSIKIILKSLFFHKKSSNYRTTLSYFYYPKLGSGHLWENVANEFCKMGGKIIYNTKVSNVIRQDNEIKSILCYDGSKFEGELFISSIPLKELLQGMNDVPCHISNIAQRLPYREFVIVALLIEKKGLSKGLLYKKNQLIEDNWIYIQDKRYEMGRIQIFDNWSNAMNKNKNAMLVGIEFFCQKNDDLWNLSNKEWENLAIKNLENCNILSDSSFVIDSCIEKVENAYPAYWDGYLDLEEIISFINSFDNLFCVGRNGQHRYNNIDHSMETSFALIDFLFGNISDKSTIWNVNNNKEYCETNIKT